MVIRSFVLSFFTASNSGMFDRWLSSRSLASYGRVSDIIYYGTIAYLVARNFLRLSFLVKLKLLGIVNCLFCLLTRASTRLRGLVIRRIVIRSWPLAVVVCLFRWGLASRPFTVIGGLGRYLFSWLYFLLGHDENLEIDDVRLPLLNSLLFICILFGGNLHVSSHTKHTYTIYIVSM